MNYYFIIVSVILLTLGLALLWRRAYTWLAGTSTTGTVVAHETSTMDDTTAYLPTVKFIDQNGNTHTFTSRAGGANPKPNVGDSVQVKYLPANPKFAYIDSIFHLWVGPFACIFLGLCALYVAWQIQQA